MDLSIIIVNWNSAEYTLKCISSIRAFATGCDYEIIVVDNGSTDGSYDLLRQRSSGVKVLRSDENLGFARANNWAFEHSTGKCILFLNPDTEITTPAISMMHSYLLSTRGVGAVGCRLLNADGTVQTSCVQRFPTILNQITDIEWLRLRFPGLSLWGIRPLIEPGRGIPSEVEVVSGACVMVKRDVFTFVGGFSTDYFMYSEDLDLSYKVRKAGWTVCHMPGGTVVHYGKQSSKKRRESGFNVVLMRESIFRFLQKTRGPAYAWMYRSSLLAVAVPRLAVSAILLVASTPARRTRMRETFKKWWRIARWSVGREGWSAQLSSPQRRVAVEKG